MTRQRLATLTICLLLTLLGGAVFSGGRGLAQDGTPEADAGPPPRPAHIHQGRCGDALGDIVAPLNDLTAAAGESVGQANRAVSVQSSFSNVALALDAILADRHAINVHQSADEIGTYIACGEIGGNLEDNGALVIGLQEQSRSGYTGVAYLSPGADGVSTDVSVFIAEVARSRSGGATDEAGTPVADEAVTEDDGEAVAAGPVTVSLTEFEIGMPTELDAGPTTFEVTNNGDIPHNFEIEGQGIEEEFAENLQPGESGTLEVELEPGTYTIYCPVGNHREQGMELELTVN